MEAGQLLEGLPEAVFAGGAAGPQGRPGARGEDPGPATPRSGSPAHGRAGIFFGAGSLPSAELGRSGGGCERDGALSLSGSAPEWSVSRSSQYYRPKGESAEDLALMPHGRATHGTFYGSRQLMRHLRREGVAAGAPDPAAHAPDGDGGDLPVGRARAWRVRSTGSSPICCGASRSRGRTTCGARTSPMSR